MSKNNYWVEYKEKVISLIGEFESGDARLMLYDLTDAIGALFASVKTGVMDSIDVGRIMEDIGQIYYCIATLELSHELPESLYTDMIGTEVDPSAAENVNIEELHMDFTSILGELSHHLAGGDLSNIQYKLNELVATTYDMCLLFNINTLDPLKVNLMLLNGLTAPESVADEAEFKEQVKDRRKAIRDTKYEEVLLEMITDNRSKVKPIKGVRFKGFGEKKDFKNGDLVTDFFRAAMYVDKIKKHDKYSINYGYKLRSYITYGGEVMSGFLIGDKLVSAGQAAKQMGSNNGVVTLSKSQAKPILMHSDMKSMNDLLDYINTKESEDVSTES